MGKTPKTNKIKRSPSKTIPSKLKRTPSMENGEKKIKRLSLRREKIDFDALCTPGRTTRSMARVTSNDIPPPMPSYVTPSKRKTTSVAKSSAKKSISHGDQSSIGTFVRPLSRQSKRVTKAKEAIEINVEVPTESSTDEESQHNKQKMVKLKHAQIESEDGKSENDEDLPSVSFLGSIGTPIEKLPRKRKSKKAIKRIVDSEADSESDTKQIPNKSSGSLNKSRKSIKKSIPLMDTPMTDSDVDLPSVSMLGASEKRKSFQNSKEAKVDAKSDSNIDTVSMELDQLNKNEELMNAEKVISSSNNEASEDMDMQIDIEIKDEPVEKKNEPAKDNNPVVTTVMSSNDCDESSALSSTDLIVMGKNANGKKSNNKRISVIDLTDSPLVQKRSDMNKTFSPIKENEEEAEAKDRTFTESEDVSNVNNKTFSPVPTNAKAIINVQVSTPRPPMNKSLRKSTEKKNVAQVKRLQNAHFLKPHTRNNLENGNKLTSAKKAKLLEAVNELVEMPKIVVSKFEMDTLKVPSATIKSPRVYKFGEESNVQKPFRFSLVAPHLKTQIPQLTGK